jgi:hypothetical protein
MVERNLNDKISRDYWKSVELAAKEAAKLPAWMKGGARPTDGTQKASGNDASRKPKK